MTGHDIGPRTSKPLSPSEELNSRILKAIVGLKDLATPAHLISSPRPTPRKKKCPRTSIESLDCQDILPKTTLSSTNQDHEKGKCHTTKGSLLEHPKGKPKRSGLAVGAW